jgi:hypothetical protein
MQAFVSELSIEALDEAVLPGPARLNQHVSNAMQSCPNQEDVACEFLTVICANRNCIAPKFCSKLLKPCNKLAVDAKARRIACALVAEIMGNSEVFDLTTIEQTARHEVNVPYIVDLACNLNWHSLG